MALRISTGLRDAQNSSKIGTHAATITGTTIAAVDGGGSADSLTDSGSGFVTAGFTAGDVVIVKGFTGGAVNLIGPFTLVSVVAGTMTVATGSLADDAAGESATITALSNGSLKNIFKDGVMDIYTGTQPATADLTESGTKLASITESSGAFVAGAVANGLEFQDSSAGVMAKLSTETWSGLGLAIGNAGWFRFYTNAYDTGASSTAIRFDGSVAVSGGELNLNALAVIVDLPINVITFTVTMPAA